MTTRKLPELPSASSANSTDLLLLRQVDTDKNITVSTLTDSLTQSTESVKGVIELANSSEALAGTDNEKAMTPTKVKEVINSFGLGLDDLPDISTDTEDLKTTGFYHLSAGTNRPTADDGHGMIVISGNDPFDTQQLAIPQDEDRLYLQRLRNGVAQGWVSIANLDDIKPPTTTVIEVSGTYIPPVGVKTLEFISVGSGGGSGWVDGSGTGTAAASSGGGAGGTTIKVTSVIESSYTVVIGAGGAGGVSGAGGGDGGDTTVVGGLLNLTAGGGFGSSIAVGSAGNLIAVGAVGGSATGGDINLKGGAGGCAVVVNGEIATLGQGGSSYFGGEEAGRFNSDGTTASTYGAGGAGVSSLNTTTNRPGSDGADGVVIVKEYY